MASTIKVDNVQNQPGTNIINKCSTTITIGASSDTVALASGATQTGFGRTGTVDWVTTPQTGTVTAATGKGYFVNTTSGEITVNLPAGAAGSIVAVSDYASTAASNNIVVEANGSEKINADAGPYTITTAGLAVTLVYVDSTRGWKSVTGSDADATGVTAAYVTATGGTIATVCTNFKTHTFTTPGTFCVSATGNPAGSDTVSYMVVAGGGGGGGVSEGGAGGAGGGGFREGKTPTCSYTASPLNAPAGLPVSVQGYPIDVGGGGTAGNAEDRNPPGTYSTNGVDSTFSTITSTGGGKGGQGVHPYGAGTPSVAGGPGGSGGGGAGNAPPYGGCAGGTATPITSPAQGTAGGDGHLDGSSSCGQNGGGGGGATVAGTAGAPSTPKLAGPGGTGATTSISASPTAYSGGGGGGSRGSSATAGTGGTGGGGAGTINSPANATDGSPATGGGGGGAGRSETNPSTPTGGCGGGGGGGIVIIRYKFQ